MHPIVQEKSRNVYEGIVNFLQGTGLPMLTQRIDGSRTSRKTKQMRHAFAKGIGWAKGRKSLRGQDRAREESDLAMGSERS